ncbi:SGNH/GDSL hydrolase family protein [Citricoccus sp. CH26A]|uniref:SGNH/GDSL hydrolase family protein n=1 Tax=Citricoccus TaxID=169133 RepID=UPI0011457EB7|nr:SGNH/GDSL hydrolase family protein [Citricoccus sp. CH26A]
MRNPNVTKTLQWTALILVLAVTSALVTLLFLQQRQYRTEAAVARTAESAESTPQPSSSPNASADAAAKAEESAKAAAAAKIAAMAVVNGLQSPVISVLGDSTSDSSSEWVYRWAEELGQNATVVVHTWNPQTNDWFPQPRQFGQGERTITIWNGSESGATPQTPLAQEDLRQPQPAHLTILNYGHNGSADEVESALTELLEAVEAGEEAPVVLTAQNPATGEKAKTSEANRALMEAAAKKHGLPVIDVHAAFDDAESWEALLVDQIHPNEQGQQLWAETVSAFFTR